MLGSVIKVYVLGPGILLKCRTLLCLGPQSYTTAFDMDCFLQLTPK